MGFGEEGFGEVGFGLSPSGPPNPRIVPPFEAFDVDLARRDIPLDENGFYRSIHSVDHRVLLNLSTELGVVLADPTIGTTLYQVPFDSDARMTADADRRVRKALSQMVRDGDISIVGVRLVGSTTASGRMTFEFEYQNMRLPEGERERKQIFESM